MVEESIPEVVVMVKASRGVVLDDVSGLLSECLGKSRFMPFQSVAVIEPDPDDDCYRLRGFILCAGICDKSLDILAAIQVSMTEFVTLLEQDVHNYFPLQFDAIYLTRGKDDTRVLAIVHPKFVYSIQLPLPNVWL